MRKEARVSKYRECFEELSIAAGVVLRVERLIIPKDLIPDILETAHEGHPGMESILRQLYW